MVLLPVKVGQGDLQLVISLAGQSVEVVKAKPALSLKNIYMSALQNYFRVYLIGNLQLVILYLSLQNCLLVLSLFSADTLGLL